MITQLVLDTVPQGTTTLLRAGLPVQFVAFTGGRRTMANPQHYEEFAIVETPEGTELKVPTDCISSSIQGPEETISALATEMGIAYDTLVKAAREDRILARKSGSAWLSTMRAIEYAIEHGTIRPRCMDFHPGPPQAHSPETARRDND